AIGTLYIRASTAVLDKKINDYLMNMLIGLIGLIFITYFLAARFQQVISQPILKLAKVTEHITRDADYSVRVEKEGEDEITTLYQGFNNMLEQLQVREQQRDLAEGEQKRLMVELGEKNKELEQVVYVTSHDLRSPLVNIQGFSKELGYSLEELSELLDTDAIPTELKEKLALILDEDVPDSLKFILSSTTKMDTLLSGLLKLSRVGRTATTFGDINMNELFTEISNAFEFQVKEGGIDLTLQEDLPPCFGNDVQLNQLFSNLVNNALKYRDMNKKGIIRIHGLTEEDGSVMYCVSDNGVGIQPDHQKKVFEIFHRLNPSETQGEGLGLSIVNKIVSRHSGKIWVESEWGKGSSFCVRLDGAKGVPSPKDQA
ncbi:MAG: HAMP domain-containing protein, partial [bacterium]|nr:HAMP domain-containing protein [bacterium]